MPIGLNASILLARALSIEKRARALATSLPSALAVDMAGIELDASNIRMLLTDTLRGAYDGAAPVAELERRLTAHAA